MEERDRKSVKPDPEDAVASGSSVPVAVPVPVPGPRAAAAGDDDDDAGRTDVCSDLFDPLLALYAPAVPLPFPNIKGFNNVAAYESFVKGGRGRAKPENVEKKRLKATKGVADPERIARLKKLVVNNPVSEEQREQNAARRRRRQEVQKNVLTRMPLCKGSPLGELYRCVEEKIRVKVHIRTFKGLRGVCSGFVVAFDKFWNMAMVDVDETYREPLLGEAFHHEKALTISRLFEKLKLQENPAGDEPAENPDRTPKNRSARGGAESRRSGAVAVKPEARGKKEPRKYGRVLERHINQLFIRGENVLLVNPQPLAPQTPGPQTPGPQTLTPQTQTPGSRPSD
ncbi:U7 snRNA-associated Sm-like protein LSm11 [Liparis tanakae]|uniref:U7 snRNA-associated Sm-like protein LSm11 n=1 Tax=Liparis tanakae TaxID=230148 RepID=A0A4Z2FAW9_9TELE|nr:U7 snRNA-associated Sm-like protein LSm11 [Liparis tanakae]